MTGLPGRHLDAWLMPDELCRRLFVRGTRQVDLALVEGTLDEVVAPHAGPEYDHPGPLRPIVEALDLPVVALVDCQPRREFHLPRLPVGVDAVLLDGLEDPDDFECYRRMISWTLKKPVLAAVEALPRVRAALHEAPRDRPLPDELLQCLGSSFLKFADLDAIRTLARSRSFSLPAAEPGPNRRCRRHRIRVAYAQDEAFGAYFPDTLETLEALGAELVEFSPLRDETLPESIDLVMIGCGFPDLYAEALAENFSLITALRSHVCRGQRIYSEGGGTAYLSRSMILDGRHVPGAGILPVVTERLQLPTSPNPVSRTLNRDTWLGPEGTVVRGYTGRWRMHPAADGLDCPASFGTLTSEGDIAFHYHAVGSLIHLHLGALSEVVAAFAGPHQPSLISPLARR